MAPWDELTWFDLPRVTTFAPTFIGTIQVLQAEPRRVGIWFSSTEPAIYTVLPDSMVQSAVTNGFPIREGLQPLYFSQKEHGPMTAVAWFASFSVMSANALTITEILLKAWPKAKERSDGTGF